MKYEKMACSAAELENHLEAWGKLGYRLIQVIPSSWKATAMSFEISNHVTGYTTIWEAPNE